MNVWSREWWRLLATLAAAGLIGVLSGFPATALMLGFVLFIAWHWRHMQHLERWLRNGAKIAAMPDLTGIWDQIALYIYQFRKASRDRKQRLTAVISRFNSVASAIPDAVVVLREHREIDWANRAAQRLLGIHPRDVGQRIDNLLRDPAFHEYIEARDFERELELVSPVRSDVQLGIRIVPFDVDSYLLRARDMSEQARVRKMRRDFVANVSHELRSPLTVITGYLESFQAEQDIPAPLRGHLQTLAQQVHRMNDLVEDLLHLSRLEGTTLPAGSGKRVPVGALLAVVVEEARNVGAISGHVLALEAESGLDLMGAEAELLSVFSNLVMNAVQHTPEGSRVSVFWRRTARGEACFEVRDNGPGIEAKHLNRLTERFYRVDSGRSRDKGGTGLGLSIVKHILQRHNAHFDIYSEPGAGTRVRCTFPPDRIIAPRPDQAA
ncbi:MAG: phosphate regulon sensor histidine kinase PhoR [Gammaproteobacteria bacterium]|nr:phosphate regulon sensor histidine kinase PhoR [Gammaproteobacteria bacterium]